MPLKNRVTLARKQKRTWSSQSSTIAYSPRIVFAIRPRDLRLVKRVQDRPVVFGDQHRDALPVPAMESSQQITETPVGRTVSQPFRGAAPNCVQLLPNAFVQIARLLEIPAA